MGSANIIKNWSFLHVCQIQLDHFVVVVGGGGEGVASAKHEAQAQILDMLQTWQSDLTQVKVRERERNKEKETDSDSGRDSNPQPGKWPPIL